MNAYFLETIVLMGQQSPYGVFTLWGVSILYSLSCANVALMLDNLYII